jgi:hypothetical protein
MWAKQYLTLCLKNKKMLTTFFSINASDTNSIIGYGSDLIGNFMPILVVLIGIAIAVFIIRAIFTMK